MLFQFGGDVNFFSFIHICCYACIVDNEGNQCSLFCINICSDEDISKKIYSKIIQNNLQLFVKIIKQARNTTFIYFIEVESHRNKQECEYIAAR